MELQYDIEWYFRSVYNKFGLKVEILPGKWSSRLQVQENDDQINHLMFWS